MERSQSPSSSHRSAAAPIIWSSDCGTAPPAGSGCPRASASTHRHRMPLIGGWPPHDGQVQLGLLLDCDPAGVEEALRVRERCVLRAQSDRYSSTSVSSRGRMSSNARYWALACLTGRSRRKQRGWTSQR